eukprot:TRINITY_DN3909_c0_g1_i2.p2 TRINITY_DN3909_c0_g1~~TRINITY_DN3909_c0_g1_i2.p2  ORF type:complete len:177 (-),score=59.73 TRINITY_DN3909_c0_g1_i2:43-573(-)
MCTAKGKDGVTPCKSKALNGFLFCWHHAPLDPNSPFIFCQFKDPVKRSSKKCYIPVAKKKRYPYCNYHIKTMVPNWKDDGSTDAPPAGYAEDENPMQDGMPDGADSMSGSVSSGEDDYDEDEPGSSATGGNAGADEVVDVDGDGGEAAYGPAPAAAQQQPRLQALAASILTELQSV